ncbi:MAG: RnfABCDGE type electron transport complex subunit B [Burkholderiaceae bacterium]|nr:RnfABCDGE type electron transport complex subunit B [Burkholderiaceae bacterium]
MNLIEQIDDILPQTQCRQCGYDGCIAYACAIAMDGAPINRCAPGGQKGIDELARLLDRETCALDPEYGQEMPLEVAHINAEHCIGCRKCVVVCPTNAIVGAPKRLHGILTDWCTGCALCVTPCPVDCIEMVPAPFEWTRERAHAARQHYREKLQREEKREQERLKKLESDSDSARAKKRALIASILDQVNLKI